MNRQEMAEQAAAAVASRDTGIRTANCIAIFAMFVLQDLMVQQLVNPVTNFNNILALANTIASLNGSVRELPL